MGKLEKLYEGKAKKVFSTENPDYCIVSYKDDATAFNGEKKGTIIGKGVVNNRMSNFMFKLLEEKGIPTDFVEELNDRDTVLKKVEIVPLEVIVRNKAAGSLSKRLGLPEGTPMKTPVLEFCYKNDELGDPMVNEYHILAAGFATKEEIDTISKYALKINEIMIDFFKECKVDLIDFKIEFGRYKGQILLADEINRATPRTQSALLECMEEHQVTVDGETRKLGFPFIVIATQNPIETAGTYQLPEAQLDRFLLQISMGYPKQNEELEIIKRFMTDSPLESLSAVCNADDVKGMVKEAEGVHVDEAIMNYIVDIADKTRNNINIAIGVSTRGVINMVKAVKAYAYINGRNYVVPEDVYNLAIPVFAHRILLSRGISDSAHREDVMREVIGQCKVPTEDWSK